ncbi:MAG: monofunctional biosynthetic peptidoglycan transglycosylase [Paludibacter sp.]|nr:monofunctional biosynthetic peptidoglycan transglycosylase [Paludibacter sp.]
MKKNLWGKFLRIIRNIIILFFVISIGWIIVLRFVPVYITPLMLIRSVEAIVDGEMPKNSKKWVPIDKISSHMVQAVVASEDNLFMEHNGFSFDDIKKAWQHNQKGKRIKGGSTISQQTAKNVFLWNKRSYFRKGLEAYFTVLIELFWSKERIMEVYLNVIEIGDGIYGVEAAALEYFGKNASELSRSQSALIAVCLPNPRRFSPVRPSSYIQRRKEQIMVLMNKIPRVDFNKPDNNIKNKKRK